tara:strand:+ start:992 stop:1213 length:222 start_codon:yes stop_codon:yes gene_type:complete
MRISGKSFSELKDILGTALNSDIEFTYNEKSRHGELVDFGVGPHGAFFTIENDVDTKSFSVSKVSGLKISQSA